MPVVFPTILGIVPVYPAIEITEPSFNDTLQVGDIATISWNDSSSLGSINHEISISTGGE